MKVLLVNGSPLQHGCTYTALAEIAHTLQEEGIDSEIFWIGNKPIGGCIGCHGCVKLGKGRWASGQQGARNRYHAENLIETRKQHHEPATAGR